jgi:hypothetical protein
VVIKPKLRITNANRRVIQENSKHSGYAGMLLNLPEFLGHNVFAITRFVYKDEDKICIGSARKYQVPIVVNEWLGHLKDNRRGLS